MMLQPPATTFQPFEKLFREFQLQFDLLTFNGFVISSCRETKGMNFSKIFFFCTTVANNAVCRKILLQAIYYDSLSARNL